MVYTIDIENSDFMYTKNEMVDQSQNITKSRAPYLFDSHKKKKKTFYLGTIRFYDDFSTLTDGITKNINLGLV